jgi:hypothetical protein
MSFSSLAFYYGKEEASETREHFHVRDLISESSYKEFCCGKRKQNKN